MMKRYLQLSYWMTRRVFALALLVALAMLASGELFAQDAPRPPEEPKAFEMPEGGEPRQQGHGHHEGEDRPVPLALIELDGVGDAEINAPLTLAAIQQWEEKHGDIQPGSVVLVDGGWFEELGHPKEDRDQFIQLLNRADAMQRYSDEARDYLLQRKVRGLAAGMHFMRYGVSGAFATVLDPLNGEDIEIVEALAAGRLEANGRIYIFHLPM